MYEKCFPKNIEDGVPEDIANPNHWKRLVNPKTISVSKDILHTDHSTITPHFRSGHFKVLRSEFYKAARGKVIFVQSTFVRGSAKTATPTSEVLGGGNA
jgi:hypothetical protein